MLEFKTNHKLTYAEACKKFASSNPVPNLNAPTRFSTQRLDANEYPPLQSTSSGTGLTSNRPTCLYTETVNNSESLQENEMFVQTQVMDQVNFCDNFMFGNPLYFIAFLTEVINQTILAKDAEKPIDVYEIISSSAGKRMGIPIDIDQLKSMT